MSTRRDCDDFVLTRRFAGHTVRIVAERIDRAELYGVTIRVDGRLFDQRQSDDPLGEMRGMIEEAVAEIDQ